MRDRLFSKTQVSRTVTLEVHVNKSCPMYPHWVSEPSHIDLDKVNILDKEPRWFERGVKAAIYIHINQPTLNKDGSWYEPNAYYPVLTSLPNFSNSRESSHSANKSWSDRNYKFRYAILCVVIKSLNYAFRTCLHCLKIIVYY